MLNLSFILLVLFLRLLLVACVNFNKEYNDGDDDDDVKT